MQLSDNIPQKAPVQEALQTINTLVKPDVPAVGIGILSWNGINYLKQFLPFLSEISYSNAVVYVIDNNSTDGSLEYLRDNWPQVKIIETGGNFGVPGGYNRGFAQMPEPYVLMLNSDVEVDPGFLEPMVALMEADSSIAMVQSKLLSFSSRYLYEYGGAAGGMIDALGYTFCRGRIFNVVEPDRNQYGTGPVFWAGGACGLIRRSAYMQVGGMYEWFFMHFEEIDLCWRFQSAGFKVWYCAQSVAWHVGGGTLSYQSPRKTYFNFKNNLVMVFRNSPWWYLLWWTPLRFLLDMAAALKYLIDKDPKNAGAVFKGWHGLIKWFFSSDPQKYPARKKSLLRISIVLKRSVVLDFFLRHKTTCQELL